MNESNQIQSLPLRDHEKRCVVVGTTRLCVYALEQLISNGWNILSVVSEDEIVSQYCQEKKLEIVTKLDQISCKTFILFSVVNYSIVSDSFINCQDVILAINYHDSLLPKYGGLNSTTWAIYNNEETHGVTWHLISSKVDEGDILKQSSFNLSPNESAFSLNINCFEEATKLFAPLLKDLESGKIKVKKQNLTTKTYFGRDYVFDNYGIIDFNNDFEQIDRIYRSLYFGDRSYINPVASIKVCDGKKIFLVGSLDFQEQVNAVPGLVYAISESDIIIGIKGGKLSIKNLMTPEGKPVSFDETNFHVDKIIDLKKISQSELKILSKMKNEEPKLFKLLKPEKWRKNSFFRVESTKDTKYRLSLPLNNINASTTLSKVAFTLLKFINSDLCIPVKFNDSFKGEFLNELVKQECFIRLSLNQKKSNFSDFDQLIQKQCAEKFLAPTDFFYRYNLEASYDVGIVISSNDSIDTLETNNRLSIFIDDKHLHISGYQSDKILLDSIWSSLISILNGKEEEDIANIQNLLLSTKNNNFIDPEDSKDFLDWFEIRAQTTPNAVAIVFEDQKIDYATLNQSANQFARYLKKLGATRETVIGLGLDRSPELIISILGILKAGSAFLPLDPTHPKARLQFMLEDSGAEILVTHSLLEVFSDFQGKKVFIDREREEIRKEESSSLKIDTTESEQLAYILYTSGTTGKPKGVEVIRSGLNSLLSGIQQQLNLSPLDRFLALTTISFDISILEILLPLRQGASVVLGNREIARDPVLLTQILEKNEITFAQATPATWQMLIDDGWRGCPDLTILCGGEALSQKLANQLTQLSRTLWNMYGPTETTIWSSMKQIQPSSEKITIGTPISGTQFYILDQEMNQLPIGVSGELYIGGLGLARGYRNRPELTKEKFITSPFGRLYKTGDLARVLPNGEVDFLGRIDTQVKIHGYRIELKEIEELINKCSHVEKAVVVVQEEKPGDNRIIAYYRGNAKREEITDWLNSHLPSYMIPSAYVQVKEFTLNLNGKIDRKALPKPNYDQSKSAYAPPQNPIEAEIVKVFETILDIERIGREDNFFALGGHSLLAARVVKKLNQSYQVNLSMKGLFEKPTPALLAKELQKAMSKISKVDRIPSEMRSQSSGISSSQQGIWFLSNQMPNSALYSIPFSLEFAGSLDVSSLQKALHAMVNRHEILRTVFSEGLEGVESKVLNHIEMPLPYKDISGASNPLKESSRLLALEAKKPFDLERGPLFRFLLLRLSGDKHLLFMNFHHMIFDGHSTSLFIQELKALYEAYKNGKSNPLDNLSIQYSDYARWRSKQPLNKEHISWWCENLQDAPMILSLPADQPRPSVQTYQGALVDFPIANVSEIQALKKIAQNHKSTLFSVLLAAFHVFLTRYTRQNDVVVGVPVSNRTHEELDSLIGYFVDSLPVRTQSRGDISFSELVGTIQNDWLKAFEHQDIPFERIVQELKIERSLSHSPVFQTMFNMLPKMDIEKMEDLNVHLHQIDRGMAHFDLSLSIQETSEGLSGVFEYSTDLFYNKTILRMARHFNNLIKIIIANPDVAIGKMQILDQFEIDKMMVEWNKQEVVYSTNETILELIEKSAEKWPNAIAVICGEDSYTYSQLNSEANRIAHTLLAKGIKKEDKVAVCLERSAAFIPTILGILKAGGAYVPLDPIEPQERMNAKITELHPFCILTQKSIKPRFQDSNLLCVDALPPASTLNPRIPISKNQLSYMIYTSGTTGKPKGVEIEYGSINDRVLWKQAAYDLNSDDVMLHTYSFIFDGSIINYLWPLCTGSKLVIATKTEQFDSAALIQLIQNYSVTTVDLLPSLLNGLVDENEFPLCSSLKIVFSGGEPLPMDLVRSFYSKSSARLLNTYGPTETTVEASVWECNSEYPGMIAPIGKTIAGAKLYILDSNGNLVPEGVSGELYIGGIGLARGYFKDSNATQEKFVSNLTDFGRVYRTGDLVKYLSDGTIEFLGRIDSHQIKLRGYRIDLREIELSLMKMDEVEKAIVVVKGESDNKRLVAYVKVRSLIDETAFFELMKHSLKKSLPSYMIPQQLCVLDEFPVLLNGKIDIKGLPEPKVLSRKAVNKRKLKSKLAQQLLTIWKEVLELETIHAEDNFFEIGGNSLLAMRLMVKIRHQMNLSIPLIQFFQNPTIETLAQSIKEKKNERPWSPLVPMITKGQKEPFFCVHPVGGSVMCYNSMLKHWGEDRPFYALQARGLEEGQLPYDSIEMMAKEYIEVMRQVQKTGPYFIGGWSFGGLVAAEMARQLEQMGEKVSRIILIDTTANIEKFQNLDTEDESLLLSELTQHFQTELTTEHNLTIREKFARFINNGGKGPLLKTEQSHPVDRLISLAKANYRAIKKFAIPSLNTDVFLLKTESNPEEDLGWDRYAKNVTVFSVPGNHWGITQAKKASHYAQVVQESLEFEPVLC